MLRGTTALLVIVAACACLSGTAEAYNNGLGATPPMGWNTWCTEDACGLRDVCNEEEIKTMADAMVSTGMHALGYEYINLDDCWSDTNRTSDGQLQPDPSRFPSGMASLASYIHSKDLKLGLYLCIGETTCRRGRPGSWNHYEQDAKTVTGWGVDFVKVDNCGHPPNAPSIQSMYTNFSTEFNKTGHPVLFSLCEWGRENVTEWGADVGQMYRIQMDHLPFWHFPPTAAGEGIGQGTYDIIQYMAELNPSKWTKQYGWMDPDFTETLFPTLPWVDSRTEFSFWCLWSAPILIATEINHMSDAKKKIVMNPEVIAIDQDPAAKGGYRVSKDGDVEIWAKELAGGDMAFILFNAHEIAPLEISVEWSALGLSPTVAYDVRDLWSQVYEGAFPGSFKKLVFAHDVFFGRVSAPNSTAATN